MILPRIIYWNYRGAGSKNSVRHFLDLIRTYSSDILILLETRVQSSNVVDILNRSYLSSFLASEANGFAGGIWILWNSSVVNVELISMDDQFINVIIDNFITERWILTAVYASPKLAFRRSLWLYLEELGKIMFGP